MHSRRSPAKGRWFDYDDQRERFEARELAQLRARKQNLTKYAAGELAEVARARDEELRNRLERLAAMRWTLLLDTPGLAAEIRTLEAAITTSYRTRLPPLQTGVPSVSQPEPDEPGHIARGAFIDTITQSGVVSRDVAQQVFEGFAAIQQLRSGVIVFDLDDLDARELVAAAQLCQSKRGSARRRLRTDLFDVYGARYLDRRDYDALLTLGAESSDQLSTLMAISETAWRQGASLSDRVKGRISRKDFTNLLREHCDEIFGRRTQTNNDQRHSDKHAPKPVAHSLLCRWELEYLPAGLREKILSFRRANLVEERHLRLRHHRLQARVHRSWNAWRRFVLRRRTLRGVVRVCVERWSVRALQEAVNAWSAVTVAEIMACRAQRFARAALGRIQRERRAKEMRSAARIQLTWRGFQARTVFAKSKATRAAAAGTVQKFWRTCVAAYDVKMALYRSLRESWQQERIEACIRIQSAYRVYLSKLKVISRRQALQGRRSRAYR